MTLYQYALIKEKKFNFLITNSTIMRSYFIVIASLITSLVCNSQVIYSNQSDAIGLINMTYRSMQSVHYFSRGYYELVEIAGDDCMSKRLNDPIDNFKWTATTSSINLITQNFWYVSIQGIQRANLVLDVVPKIKMDPIIQNRVLGEAYFLRAFYHFYFVQIFGDVPLYKSFPKDSSDLFIARSPKDNVYSLIESDLLKAEEMLPTSYHEIENWRATKYAAKALLGKSYLFNKKYSLASQKLKEVIDSGVFSLLTDYSKNFHKNHEHNAESVFEVEFVDLGADKNGFYSEGGNSGESTQRDLLMGIQNQIGQRAFGDIVGSNYINFIYEYGDVRKKLSVYTVLDDEGNIRTNIDTLSGYDTNSDSIAVFYRYDFSHSVVEGGNQPGQYFHIRKGVSGYTGKGGLLNSPNNYRVIRYADVLLMYAEALCEANGGPTTAAIEALNKVRQRARAQSPQTVTIGGEVISVLPDYPANFIDLYTSENYYDSNDSPLTNFRKAIVHERQVELAFEYHRFLDLRRWDEITDHPGGASKILKDSYNLPYDKTVHKYFPIPITYIRLSKNKITQNFGY